MPLDASEQDQFDTLRNRLQEESTTLSRLDGYYEGLQRLEQLGLAIPPELRKFVVIVNWPRVAVDAVEQRLDVEGFLLADEEEADRDLWRVWQANDLDEESQLAHVDALALKRAYICVGSNENDPDTPIVTVESPHEMIHAVNPRTRELTAALRMYDVPEGGGEAVKATLYLPNVTVWLERRQGVWVDVDRDEHNLGRVPVEPLVNRARSRNRYGVSEMADVIPVTDAAARSLTNLQVAQETHAIPQRGVLGASKGDFVDQNGKQLPVWEAYFGSVWALANENAKTFQFSASDLRNFETTVNMYGKLAASVSGLPSKYFGLTTDVPASADAIRSDEARLVKLCERKQRPWGGSYERTMRTVRRFQEGEWDPRMRQLETLWRDPATPTVAQKADATVKLVQAGVLPVESAWEDLGYSAARRQRLRSQRTDELRGMLQIGEGLLDG